MNKRRRKRRPSRTKESFLLAGVTSLAGILVLIMTVAFLKPEVAPIADEHPPASTELSDGSRSDTGMTDAQSSETGMSQADHSSVTSGQQSSDVLVTTGNVHTDTSSDGTASQNPSGTIQPGSSQAQTSQDGLQGQASQQGQIVQPGSTEQTGQQGQDQQQGIRGQVPPQGTQGQSTQQETQIQSGQMIQPSGQETQDGIIPGTLLPSDGSMNYGVQNQTPSGYNATDQSGYQETPSSAAPTAILMSPDNYELVVASAYVNIRNLPSLDSLILSVLAEGGAILRDDNTGGWSRVYYNGRTAYIYSKYLIPIR